VRAWQAPPPRPVKSRPNGVEEDVLRENEHSYEEPSDAVDG
jgi:hypothetical protein